MVRYQMFCGVKDNIVQCVSGQIKPDEQEIIGDAQRRGIEPERS